MPKIPVEKLCAGDRLAGPLVGAGGQVLLAAGATLTETHIGLLKGRGILLVSIEERAASQVLEPDVSPPSAPPASLEQLQERAAPELARFGDLSNQPIMEALMRAVMKRRAGSPGR